MASIPDRQRIVDDIRKYGCHVLQVRAGGGEPPFANTVGIGKTSDAPDLVVVGQSPQAAHLLLHAYNQRIRRGERFVTGQMASGFLKGQDVAFRPVHASHFPDLFPWNAWLHGGLEFRMLQLVYPSREGFWPWDALAEAPLRRLQPLLERPAGHPTA